MLELLSRTLDTLRQGDWKARICRGNLLSRVNYELDITRFGYLDGRRWDEAERAKEAPHGEGTGLEAPRRGGR
ncbi:MAG: hypothetical protein HYU46_16035 [Deltaproteobacteria bacterium]|nr:hypothetical protein [Deltaproteobacteria bacterium]